MSSKASHDVVELRVGHDHAVRLPGLGTAGYRWAPHLEGDASVAEVTPAGTEPPAQGGVGASASEVFTIRARRPGVARIRFSQRRPWESEEQPPAKQHLVELHVLED